MGSFFSRILRALKGAQNPVGDELPPHLRAKAERIAELFKEMASVLQLGPPAPNQLSPSSIESTALVLFTLLRPKNSDVDELWPRIQPKYPQIDLNRLRWELLYLRVFAIDFAAFKVFGPGGCRGALLDRVQYHASGAFGHVPGFEDSVRDRLMGYALALRTPHPVTPLFNLGKGFAHACGAHPYDLDMAFMAGSRFAATVEAAELLMRDAPLSAT
jgi:hypothetical protein